LPLGDLVSDAKRAALGPRVAFTNPSGLPAAASGSSRPVLVLGHPFGDVLVLYAVDVEPALLRNRLALVEYY
jgi:hypothetical protein